MTRFGRASLVLVAAALATAAGVLLLSGDDTGDDGQGPAGMAASAPPTRARSPESHPDRQPAHPNSTRRQVREAVAESEAARLDPSQRRVARAVRAYVAALDAHRGERVCSLFVPGGLAKLQLPRDRGSCARSISASIGYRDPRGFPVYESSRVARIPAVTIDGSTARVTATTVTRFADDREPSVEDDVIYLQNRDGRWLIAKPSATLYRAIGVGDIPPQVLAPP